MNRCWTTRLHRGITAVVAAVAMGTFATVAPSQAALPPPSTGITMVRAAATGDLTVTLDLGQTLDRTTFQQIVDADRAAGPHLSDVTKRAIDENSLGPDLEVTQPYVAWDGTVDITPGGTGLSLTVPGSEVQTALTWMQGFAVLAIATLGRWFIRMLCISVLTASGVGAALVPVICTPAAGFIANLIAGLMSQAFDHKLSDPTRIAITVSAALFGLVDGFLWEKWLGPFAKGPLADGLKNFGAKLVTLKTQFQGWLGSAVGVFDIAGQMATSVGEALPGAIELVETGGVAVPTSTLPCDVYAKAGTPCVSAHSPVRAMYSYYNGPLYQVQRTSDRAYADIRLLSRGGYADAAAQDAFCANTSCIITQVYDQSPEWNDLGIEGAGSAGGADHGADASALPIEAGGHKAYGIYFGGQTGYRDNTTHGVAVGDHAEGMYMVASGTHVNSGCCFDYGNAETSTTDTGDGHMDAVNLGTECYFPPCAGSGPWVEADLENGLFSGGDGSNLANKGNSSNFVTALLKNNGTSRYALKGGDSQTGGLSTWYDGGLPTIRGGTYIPMKLEGSIVLGTGGDNSNWSVGSFFEGAMTLGYPTDAADDKVQSGIVAAGYAGNSGGQTASAAPTAAGQAVIHDGYSSVYTVNSANNHLQETYLPKMNDAWATQDLSAKYGTPPVLAGTKPVTVTHDGYTSVFTVDAGSGHLQETFLPRMGDPWSTQDLSARYGTPATSWTPTAVVHDGYTSVWSVNAVDGHLQETYLPKMGDPWFTQDLTAKYGSPQVQAGSSPVAVVHDGYTSVFTATPGHHLQETYLPKMNDPWSTQDLTAKYGAPATSRTPTTVVHDGYTSVWTVDDGNDHLQETYLPKMNDPWSTQDLTAKYGAPSVAPGTAPVAFVHSGYTSVFTVAAVSMHVQETFLPHMGDAWSTQDLSAKYGAPPTSDSPVLLLHPDTSGAVTWSSVYTVDQDNLHLQETYLAGIGSPWATQDLSAKYGAPQVAATQFPAAGWSVNHDGYASTYTVSESDGHLWETYLTAMNKPWAAQDLSAKYGTPKVNGNTTPVSLTHDGYTSVYTTDFSSGHLQETYLTAMNQPWHTQDLSQQAGTPASRTTPTAVFHTGYTSVYTVASSDGHLWETYLPALGGGWYSQDLTQKYGTAPVLSGTSPVAALHSGWTSVYTVDGGSYHLRETYLPALGLPWTTQDLSAKYGTPPSITTPAVLVHDGFTSLYTLNFAGGHLQETYLPDIGDNWSTQDLTQKYGTPAAVQGIAPVAVYHAGYASVYTVDLTGNHLQETYLPAIGAAWATQDLSAKYGTPAVGRDPSVLVHADTTGGLTWASVYTVNNGDGHLQETYLPKMGDPWATQDLSAKYGSPPV